MSKHAKKMSNTDQVKEQFLEKGQQVTSEAQGRRKAT